MLTTQGLIQGRAISPLKPTPTKVVLFTIILYSSEKTFAIKGHSVDNCFVTAVLWSILSYSNEAVMRLDYQILLKLRPQKITGWIRPCNNRNTNSDNFGERRAGTFIDEQQHAVKRISVNSFRPYEGGNRSPNTFNSCVLLSKHEMCSAEFRSVFLNQNKVAEQW